ncbi:HpcH/HpaI aldolase/citrate lyase family protein [uncultured Ralstonia sp.]|jgi:4-hydroxy-2-oxoheptanedioate aldolase|uniref:HpcH/HpaI aldolase family protein n=1 Tax=Ralstonia sp. TaxID=54061 RepID=UPI001EA67F79|nr:HpcH/HpaI aldolase/citrate lyase family protein [uncultured Ralstonia sp.]UCF24185.1 MAG: HpcH/HpaI aldolase/citrate lyase family protein [Ralstonia sp.]
MQRNRFKAQLLARKQQLGIWSMLAASNVAEVLTQSDYDWILLDTEHAPNEVPMVLEQLRTVAQTAMSAVVRPATNDPVPIKRLLDIGAQTLLVPMVDTADDARRAVAAVRYPPLGMRGVSLATRANRYGRDADYGQNANDEVCLLVQLETPKALANLEQIAAVEGIDALFIGPADLAATLGHLGNARHPDVQGAIHNARARAHACGKPIGILMADPELSAQYIRDGFDYVAVATDISLLRAGAEAALKQARTHQRS